MELDLKTFTLFAVSGKYCVSRKTLSQIIYVNLHKHAFSKYFRLRLVHYSACFAISVKKN